MNQRRELLDDLRTEQVVRTHVVTQLENDQSALDLTIESLGDFLGLNVGAMPAPTLQSIRITAEVTVPGQTTTQTVDIEVAVPAVPSTAVEQHVTGKASLTGSGSLGHGTLVSRAALDNIARVLSTVDFSQVAAMNSVRKSLQQMDTPVYQTQVAAILQAFANASAHSTVSAVGTARRPLKDVLLELFSRNPGSWFTMQEVMTELEDRGVEAEYEEVRKTIHGLHAIYPQLEKPTRKSWVWLAPRDADDDGGDEPDEDHDGEGDEDHDGDEPDDDHSAEEHDGPAMSDFVSMSDHVSRSDYMDSDGVTTTHMPLEAQGD